MTSCGVVRSSVVMRAFSASVWGIAASRVAAPGRAQRALSELAADELLCIRKPRCRSGGQFLLARQADRVPCGAGERAAARLDVPDDRRPHLFQAGKRLPANAFPTRSRSAVATASSCCRVSATRASAEPSSWLAASWIAAAAAVAPAARARAAFSSSPLFLSPRILAAAVCTARPRPPRIRLALYRGISADRKIDEQGQPYWTRERILRVLQQDAKRRGKPPSSTEWRRALGVQQLAFSRRGQRRPSLSAVLLVFGSWNAALAAAGLPIRTAMAAASARTASAAIL
jgi:hypothetical protein